MIDDQLSIKVIAETETEDRGHSVSLCFTN